MNLCEAKTFCARSGRMVQCSYEENHDPAVPHAVMSEGVELVWTGEGSAEPMGIISELVHYAIAGGDGSLESPAIVCMTREDGADLYVFALSQQVAGMPAPMGYRRAMHDPQGRPGSWHLASECGRQQRKR